MSTSKGNHRSPERREHFVYYGYDRDGSLLYIGCTMRPKQRWAEHRANGTWAPLAARFTMRGPFNYDVARQIEREEIGRLQPTYNQTPQFESYTNRRAAWLRRRTAELLADLAAPFEPVSTVDYYACHVLASEEFAVNLADSWLDRCGVADHYRERIAS